MNASILIVDDEQAFLDSVTRMLRIEGYSELTPVSDPTQVPGIIDTTSFDLALLDITMPDLDGMDLLKIIKETSPQTECVMITAHESIPMVIQAVRLGAYDYLTKPVTPDQLAHSIERALERKHLLESLILRSREAITKALDHPTAFQKFVTNDNRMLKLLHEAELHAASNIPVLITGETGVGKELLAKAVHDASHRARAPFVPVNMLSLSPTLFESEFFGHKKGAFTGADRDKKGYLAQADHGTLFLDEIGDLQMEIQGKLLRILQEAEYTPVGSTRPEPIDVRFIAATNQNLDRQVEQGKFRKDLFYRLQFAHLHLNPLRNRRRDIPLLAARFLDELGRGGSFSEEAGAALSAHDWPGNVRELRAAIQSAINLAEKGVIGPQHLNIPTRPKAANQPGANAKQKSIDIEPLADVERRHILAVYDALNRNKSRTARALDIGLQTLHRKLKAFGVK